MHNIMFFAQNAGRLRLKHTLTTGVNSNIIVANGYYYYISEDRTRIIKLKTDFSEELISGLHPLEKLFVSISVKFINDVYAATDRYSGLEGGLRINKITNFEFDQIANYGVSTNEITDWCLFNSNLIIQPYENVHKYDGVNYISLNSGRGGRRVIQYKDKLYRLQYSESLERVRYYEEGVGWSLLIGTDGVTYSNMTATSDYLFLFKPNEVWRYNGVSLELWMSFYGNVHNPYYPSNIVVIGNKVYFINSVNLNLQYFDDSNPILYTVDCPFTTGNIRLVDNGGKLEIWDTTTNNIYEI